MRCKLCKRDAKTRGYCHTCYCRLRRNQELPKLTRYSCDSCGKHEHKALGLCNRCYGKTEKTVLRRKKAYCENGEYIRQRQNINYHKHKKDRKRIRNKPRASLKQYESIMGMQEREIESDLGRWYRSIRKRDQNICKVCGKPGENAHHILHKARVPKLMFSVNNGICLCKSCHNESHGRNIFLNTDNVESVRWKRKRLLAICKRSLQK